MTPKNFLKITVLQPIHIVKDILAYVRIATMNPDSLIEATLRPNDLEKKALKKLGVKTISDLLYHFPVRYGDTSEKRSIGSLIVGEKAVIFGKISGLKISKGFRSKIPMSEA